MDFAGLVLGGVCCPYRTGLVVWIMWAWFGCVSGLVCWYFSDCCVGTGGLRLIVAVGSASGFDRRVLRRWFGGGCLNLVDVGLRVWVGSDFLSLVVVELL